MPSTRSWWRESAELGQRGTSKWWSNQVPRYPSRTTRRRRRWQNGSTQKASVNCKLNVEVKGPGQRSRGQRSRGQRSSYVHSFPLLSAPPALSFIGTNIATPWVTILFDRHWLWQIYSLGLKLFVLFPMVGVILFGEFSAFSRKHTIPQWNRMES